MEILIKLWIRLLLSFVILWIGLNLAYASTILEYMTPTKDSSPADITMDGQGNLWFTEINANKIGKLIPSQSKPGTSEGIKEYDLPQPNSKPHYIAVARDGMIWFTEMKGNRIGKLDPATGKIKEYEIPTPKSEPHQIKEGEDGHIWFLEFETNKIGRFNPELESFKEFPIPEGHPHGLALEGKKVWYTQGGKFWAQVFFNKVSVLDTETGKVEEFTIPPEKSVPHGITLSTDAVIWFTEMFESKLANLTFPKDQPPKITEYLLGKRKGPHDLIVDDQRKWVWFTANRPASIGRLDLAKAEPGTNKGVEFFPTPTPKSHPSQLVLDNEGNIWFTEMGLYFRGKYLNQIGKLIP